MRSKNEKNKLMMTMCPGSGSKSGSYPWMHFTAQPTEAGMSNAVAWWCCRLQAQQKEWLALQADLLAQGSVLKGELSTSQLERTRLEGELSGLRETNQSLDLSNARLTSQYQVSGRSAPRWTWLCTQLIELLS